jgi:MFS family permease
VYFVSRFIMGVGSGGVWMGLSRLANAGSIGVHLEGVPTERIITAMVGGRKLGIVGYFIGPLAGGFVAQTVGYRAIGLVPLLAVGPVMVLAIGTRRPVPLYERLRSDNPTF